ncbi:MAG: siderophore-interacting protein [Symploca sp. SIO2G7]|nr:siderophore-interacting protein [Symploca sp. SIO2G7]
MSQPNYRTIVVKRSEKVTPNMQRVTFTGDDLADFPENYESGYVKLLFSDNGQAISDKSQAEEKRLMRTYTIRSFSREKNELAIEFSLHGDKSGPASTWAASTKPGNKILMGGPGPTKLVKNESDWFLLAGDMSGMPALCCNLEQLPEKAQGYAVIEVVSESDKQTLKVPDGIAIKWIINNHPGENSNALLNGIKSLPWKDGNPYVWVACEFNSMRKIRDYLKNSRSIEKDNIYISSYWKFNRTEEQHKVDKKIDSGAPPFVKALWGIVTKCRELSPLKG